MIAGRAHRTQQDSAHIYSSLLWKLEGRERETEVSVAEAGSHRGAGVSSWCVDGSPSRVCREPALQHLGRDSLRGQPDPALASGLSSGLSSRRGASVTEYLRLSAYKERRLFPPHNSEYSSLRLVSSIALACQYVTPGAVSGEV